MKLMTSNIFRCLVLIELILNKNALLEDKSASLALRICPFEKMLTFDLIWDGIDIAKYFLRNITH